MTSAPAKLPDEVKNFEEYPFAWHFGNIKTALEGMECTGKLPHGCPNCRGLDFCTKRDALKRYATMEKCWDYFMGRASVPAERLRELVKEWTHSGKSATSYEDGYFDGQNNCADRLESLIAESTKK